ncbi:lysine N(6)-hydroxylase/L-ornithine N(5)-oxygenase family protein [Streptomyces cacaoi]|uniref:lysine N(6)-hydroxylase/L-ornithine N(5)-oxygenase family protein n=1 Tax=Streptomyces cacaoi TaxID=1898 RepID=UPI001FD25FD6|nr:lysine N(6)-hydroxylase/L-ornithine N(5)-oxygenase family protein [Streptomyces cacaoi]
MTSTNGTATGVRDLVGVGFGPANLALAVALEEHEGPPLDALFLEKRPRLAWHPGMLLEDATMQVSFLKDLATLRNPRSAFSFLSYLHDRGRLVDFINHKEFFPSRVEFHDYLDWAAGHVAHRVRYDTAAVAVRPVTEAQTVVAFDVVTREADGGERTERARNIVLGTGLVPRMPEGVARSERVWHSEELLPRIEELTGPPPTSFAVVGAGQSAAEVAAHLHSRFPDSRIDALLPSYGYSPSDDSPFANRVFDPEAVDHFYDAVPAVRERFYEQHGNTNYAVVDLDLINELYRRSYQESVRGTRRLHFWPMCRVEGADSGPDGVRLRVNRLLEDRSTELDAGVAVFATGYHPMDAASLLGPAAELCKRDSAGRLRVSREYRVETSADVTAGIYLQGGIEHTHGISASLLSNIAVRAGEIVTSLAAGVRQTP